jgi:cytochrome c
MVDAACALIGQKGEAAFDAFRDPKSRFAMGESYIFILSEEGKAIVDPGFPTIPGRNVLDYTDAVGKKIVREMIERVQNRDSGWVIFMQNRPGESAPSKRAAFVKKIRVGGKTIIVGSDIYLANPIWMR